MHLRCSAKNVCARAFDRNRARELRYKHIRRVYHDRTPCFYVRTYLISLYVVSKYEQCHARDDETRKDSAFVLKAGAQRTIVRTFKPISHGSRFFDVRSDQHMMFRLISN